MWVRLFQKSIWKKRIRNSIQLINNQFAFDQLNIINLNENMSMKRNKLSFWIHKYFAFGNKKILLTFEFGVNEVYQFT